MRDVDSTGQRKLVSSVTTAVLMSAPTIMINFAVGAFLTGIGVYFGFVWKNDLDPLASKVESRNIFVCFIVSLAVCSSFYVIPFMSKTWQKGRMPPPAEWQPYAVFRTLHDEFEQDGVLFNQPDRQATLKPKVEKFLLYMNIGLRDDDIITAATNAKEDILETIRGWNQSGGESDLPQKSTSGKTPTEVQVTPFASGAAGEENPHLSAQNTSLVAAVESALTKAAEAQEACAAANKTLADEFAQLRGEGFPSRR